MREQEVFHAVFMRGGTSKAVFFKKGELPSDPVLRDKVILAVFGSPDIRQIDGMGGSDITTSKVAIISPSDRPDADVEYLFGQVQLKTDAVVWNVNCGNISSAVGPFAIDEGMVPVTEPYTTVRVHNVNNDQILLETVEVRDGMAAVEGDFAIDGVPGTGSRIDLDFKFTAGAKTGNILPTGNPVDMIDVEGIGTIPVSTVDMANIICFVKAEDLGATASESTPEIRQNAELLEKLEKVRSTMAVKLGFCKPGENATLLSPLNPGINFVGPPQNYTDYATGKQILAANMDFCARGMFNQMPTDSFGGTSTFCTVVASLIDGTVVNQVRRKNELEPGSTSFGHARGINKVGCKVHKDENGNYVVDSAIYPRTARRIMDGLVYVKKSRIYDEQ